MTRARDFADVISGSFDLPSGALDNATSEPIFQKTSVASTGAVSLDLSGDNNFFDAGTLTADTTVSFTNAPSKKKFTYSFIPGHNSAASSVNDTDTWQPDFTISHTTKSNMAGSAFNPDGTKVIYIDGNGDYLIETDLAVPYDDSTMVRGKKNVYSLSTYFGTHANSGELYSGVNIVGPRHTQFNADGTALFLLNVSDDRIYKFNLGTAYDLSSFISYQTLYVYSRESSPLAWCFNSDGSKVFVSGSSGDDINEYTMSTAYDIANASYTRVTGTSSTTGAAGLDAMMFGKDGTAFFGFQSHNSSGAIIKYDTSGAAGSFASSSVVTSQYISSNVFGALSGSAFGMQYIDNDRIRVDRSSQNIGGVTIECGTSYWPTFSGTISGKLGHFSRGYRHFIDFETSNTGTSYGIIDHRRIYVG